MSKKRLATLIVSMALVLSGLILVQTNTIKVASGIREEQFDQTIRHILSQVVRKLEEHERVLLLEEELFMANKSGNPVIDLPSFGNLIPWGLKDPNFSLSFSYSRNSQSFHQQMEFQFTDSIANLDQTTRGMPGDFPSAFDKLHEYNLEQQQILQRRLSDNAQMLQKFFFRSRPIEERIEGEFLNNTLKEEFAQQGINLEYRYAVKSFLTGKEKTIIESSDFEALKKKKDYTLPLFPGDYGQQPNYLVVYFPKRSGYLLKSTGIMVIPTVVLTGLLVAIFAFTLAVIFRQKKLSQIKNDFINNMTHELKTPISTISLASQMLRDETIFNTPKTIAHISNVINQESKRLGYQVEKVLQMAVFNEGRLKLRFHEFDLNDLVHNVIMSFEIRIKNRNGILHVNLDGIGEKISGDEVHITNVVFNLLDNAVKYSHEIPEITVSTEIKKEHVVLSVADKGIGIPKEHQDQIFERFFRVPTGNVHNVKGFGLGLSYVKKIVEAHNGKITVDSVPNKGTKFSIYFPLNNKIYHGTKSKIAVG
jgi:two-component system, OmpR family, phosphate regulon sensor histidine kinase PhoR